MLPQKMIKIRKKGFTLLELMISMVIFSLVMIFILSSVQSMMAARIKSMNRIALTEKLYFFSEQLFTAIKDGGTIDYEEYWNRKTYNTELNGSHYKFASGIGNFGRGTSDLTKNNFGENFFYCRSADDSNRMGTGGCAENSSLNNKNTNFLGSMQRYGEYALQFWDYNANANADNGDENNDGKIVGDEDDRNLWDGPEVFSGAIHELYLLNKTDPKNPTRTFFRWKIIDDPNKNSSDSCEITRDSDGYFTAGDHCLGMIQMLKLRGLDRGSKHDGTGADAYDGVIDTWVCEAGWSCAGKDIGEGRLATGIDSEWINLFPNTVTVRKFRLDLFPKKDPWLAAASPDCIENCTGTSPFIHPYMRYSLELGFSHGLRRRIKNENPIISISTTANLDDFR
ncbi:MAG: prepilin-type N-terminal cleavage/methylation domain-containing protein [Candidatus Gracilibacteria bacterium]|nr:prepilin-type N-terminal cleavage/methylation domain-containing protein [Candidatus Gracilibacteria bacterium]